MMYRRYSSYGNVNNNQKQNISQNNSHNGNKMRINSGTRYRNTSYNLSESIPKTTNNISEYEKKDNNSPHEKCKQQNNIDSCENVKKEIKENIKSENSHCDKVNSCREEKSDNNSQNIIDSVLRILPKSVYDNESKKFFGIIGTEDLLLIMLIFLLIENDEGENILVYALIYLLISDYIDIPIL